MISVEKNSIIIVGGTGANPKESISTEVISSDSSTRGRFPIPNFPKQITDCYMFVRDGILMVCGGRYRNGSLNETCFQLKNGYWQIYDTIKITGLIKSILESDFS